MALTNKLTAIADAIRGKTGGTDALTLDQMATEIAGIKSGGDDSVLLSILDRSITEFNNDEATNIGMYIFYDCMNLVAVNAPNVTTLGKYCLYNTKVASLTFPKVKNIPYNALEKNLNLERLDLDVCTKIYGTSMRYCYALKTLILRRTEGVVTLVGTNAFTDTPFLGYNGESGTVYVPSALIESYQTATNWSTLYAGGTCNFVAIEGSEYE